jgi:hypothetical protein
MFQENRILWIFYVHTKNYLILKTHESSTATCLAAVRYVMSKSLNKVEVVLSFEYCDC